MDNQPQKIRMQFTKTGMSVYISHLDLLRTFTRAIRRAGIYAAYSQGFNPHLLLAFSMPLSLGTSSLCEFADLQLNTLPPLSEIRDKMNAALPRSIRITAVYPADVPLSKIALADYTVTLTGEGSLNGMREKILEILSGDTLVTEKKSKRAVKEVDILPFIRAHSCNLEENRLVLKITVDAGGEKSLNPNVLLQALDRRIAGFDLLHKSIIKTNVYLADGQPFVTG